VAKDADVLVIITEWNEYRQLDLKQIAASMKQKRLVDLRNIYKPADVEQLGFHYVSIGRPEVTADDAAAKKLRAV
jgi:UDPglucose 6-dehydrogenase